MVQQSHQGAQKKSSDAKSGSASYGSAAQTKPENAYRPVFDQKNMQGRENQNPNKGRDQQVQAKLREAFGRLTDDELALYETKREQFLDKLHEKYGLDSDEAEIRIHDIERGQRAA